MKNFYSLSDFYWLNSFDLNKASSQALSNFSSYINNLPLTEQNKLNIIKSCPLIKMYSVLLKTDLKNPAGVEQPFEFFNINIDTPEDNYNNGNGKFVQEISSVFDMNYYNYYNLSEYFIDTLRNLNYDKISTAWIMSYKKNACVSPHSHNDTLLFAHILLNDIYEGYFEIVVNKECRKLNKKGEYFIFPGQLEHSAKFTGSSCDFLSFSIAM